MSESSQGMNFKGVSWSGHYDGNSVNVDPWIRVGDL
jgi:hypothetical protein